MQSSFSKAELLSRTLSESSSLDDSGQISPYPSYDFTMPEVIILNNDVFHAHSGIINRKASEPQGVPLIVLTNCVTALISCLVKLFCLWMLTRF